VEKKYEGTHVTLIACSTPVLENEILIHAQLGTRELMYKCKADTKDNDEKMDKAWDNEEYEEQAKNEIATVISSFVKEHPVTKIPIPIGMKQFLKEQAERLAILRASGIKDRFYNELLSDVVPEVPTRLIKQFKRLYLCLKSLDPTYGDERIRRIITHIVDSSGNGNRQRILDFINNQDKWLKLTDIQFQMRLSRTVVKGELETLWNMGIIEKTECEERIGGYLYTDDRGNEQLRGGKMETVSYYGKKELKDVFDL
jgi:predicted DNA-binding transcriptional regulator